jgi:hypothetical protein
MPNPEGFMHKWMSSRAHWSKLEYLVEFGPCRANLWMGAASENSTIRGKKTSTTTAGSAAIPCDIIACTLIFSSRVANWPEFNFILNRSMSQSLPCAAYMLGNCNFSLQGDSQISWFSWIVPYSNGISILVSGSSVFWSDLCFHVWSSL